jgi:hypothetical protein
MKEELLTYEAIEIGKAIALTIYKRERHNIVSCRILLDLVNGTNAESAVRAFDVSLSRVNSERKMWTKLLNKMGRSYD